MLSAIMPSFSARTCLPAVVLIALLGKVAVGSEPTFPPSQPATPAASVQTISYAEDTSDFPNPERGFYRQFAPFWKDTSRSPLDADQLALYRNEGISLFRGYYVIDEFQDRPLTSQMLAELSADFGAVRQAGIKIIPRFTYNYPLSDAEMLAAIDAPLTRVREHIQQLAPVLQANADVIAFIEVGFIGAWGEWHHSSNHLLNDDHSVNSSSAAVVQELLTAVPTRRAIALRYPYHKQALYGPSPLTAAEAFSGTARARIGAHNDCFLANEVDGGTYAVPPDFTPMVELLKSYLNQDNRFLPQGGETCFADLQAQPYIGCANALIDLARMRWSTMNIEWNPEVIARWQSEGCLPEIRRRLGFRLRMTSAVLPTDVREGRSFAIHIDLSNTGFAAPYNPRDAELVLRHATSGAVHRLPLNVDPRFWLGGANHVLDMTVTLPASVTAGSYRLLLNLPDPEPTLRTRPEYSIRLANVGTWETATGFNNLLATLSVTPPAPFTDTALTSGVTPIRSVHVMELRSRIGALRTTFDLAPFPWTDPSLTGHIIRAVHVAELRAALAEAYAAANRTAPTYSDGPPAAGGTVRATHIIELRVAVVALE